VVAPDHLFAGLAKNAIEAYLSLLPNNGLILKANVAVCSALEENGLIRKDKVFNVKDKYFTQ